MSMYRELRRLLRASLLAVHLMLGVFLALGVVLLPVGALRRRVPAISAWWLSRGIAVLGVRVLARGNPHPRPVLMLVNHISWLDILVLATQSDSGYVAKAEVAEWPLLGWLARVGGTEFIRRGSHPDLARVLEQMAWRLKAGQRITVFPEGTSGGKVLPARFRPRLIKAAVAAKVPVQPVAIYYGSHPEQIAFVGEDSFIQNLWALLGAEPVLAEITFMPVLGTVSGDCRLLADESWRSVTHALTRLELFEQESRQAQSLAVADAELIRV
ncbi:MAG TPA: lysophospholipid acyltransferase family protein [Gammaproteobacteria bacterium]|jgi:1-acyl-sn-glycerol-3-phosphate acyltransferase